MNKVKDELVDLYIYVKLKESPLSNEYFSKREDISGMDEIDLI